jgi:uncharacterized membrane protein YpjA
MAFNNTLWGLLLVLTGFVMSVIGIYYTQYFASLELVALVIVALGGFIYYGGRSKTRVSRRR